MMKIGSAGIPHGNAVGAGVGQVKIGGGNGGSEHKSALTPVLSPRERESDNPLHHQLPKAVFLRVRTKLELFGVAENGPSETAGPGSEWRVALLRIRAAISSVIRVEDTFVGCPAAGVIGIAPFAVIDAVASGHFSVLNQTSQKRNPFVALAH